MSAAARPRRIVVAVDGSPASLAALAAAAAVALRTGATVEALFAEDPDLLDLARAPAARVVAERTAEVARADPAAMARALGALAERVRDAVAEVARRARVRCEHRVVRARPGDALRAAVAGDDWVVLGRVGHSDAFGARLGSTAASWASQGRHVVLLVGRGEVVAPPVAVLDDGGDEGARAVDVARAVAGADGGRLVVLRAVPAVGGSRADAPPVRPVAARTLSAALDAARVEGARLLVVPASLATGEEALLSDAPCAVLLVP